MDRAEAQEFVDRWVQHWNARDLERLLSHFADDIVFTSPVAVQLLDDSDGVLRSKTALRDYWPSCLGGRVALGGGFAWESVTFDA